MLEKDRGILENNSVSYAPNLSVGDPESQPAFILNVYSVQKEKTNLSQLRLLPRRGLFDWPTSKH